MTSKPEEVLVEEGLRDVQHWLKKLNIDYTIEKLKNLESLNIWGSNLNSLPVSIGELKNLRHLNLSGNGNFVIPDFLYGMSNLKIIR